MVMQHLSQDPNPGKEYSLYTMLGTPLVSGVFQYVRVFRRSGLQGPGFMASGLHEAMGAQSLFCGFLTVVLLEPFVKARAATMQASRGRSWGKP